MLLCSSSMPRHLLLVWGTALDSFHIWKSLLSVLCVPGMGILARWSPQSLKAVRVICCVNIMCCASCTSCFWCVSCVLCVFCARVCARSKVCMRLMIHMFAESCNKVCACMSGVALYATCIQLCTVLYCGVLYCTVLYYTILYYTILCCTVLHCRWVMKIR